MIVLVVGGGGREHTLVWKIAQNPDVKKIYCTPGNAGISRLAECVPISAEDVKGLCRFARDRNVDLTVVGPEAPLVAGIVDAFEAAGLRIFGPDEKAARLEGSKCFCKRILEKGKVPTPEVAEFDDPDAALNYVKDRGAPIVVKADGLAAGKGVTVAHSVEEAEKAVEEAMVGGRFGDAGSRVLIEECLVGEELSILALTDGKDLVTLVPSRDHKRLGEGDTGPNTGGMGAFSPVPEADDAMVQWVTEHVLEPTLSAMAAEGCPYHGVLYAGLILTDEGPKVLEYNCRFGDPEAQVVLTRLDGDLVTLLEAAIDGNLGQCSATHSEKAAGCVVACSGGYPGSYEKGKEIRGLDGVSTEDLVIFHAGTSFTDDRVVTSGGRVLGVTGMGKDLQAALDRAYTALYKIDFDGVQYRKDIGRSVVS